ncbi:Vacuolar iron transporter -like protein 3 [Capsicum annuum]|uniref:Vacuolar iron transporter n=1 Tax=Capsicum annuum TaxID=4072 RepID=A0A2G2Y3A9_CAPAN|nr:vacuolar iron transporter homolog 4 [Capsicum annuum]KAF3659715.1 Vacuolar iron transporter -like protein 3 [Capsicum annuum]KAF3664848.1 Vacuolar iron transporter -like protein 3 [Capsicum annuum]PHT64189.1 Vacuolar iron transporter -like protein 3 [Capsicum annuum]
MATQDHVQITIPNKQDNQNQVPEEDFDHSQMTQWLRAAVLGASDGLVSTASLMMGVGAVQKDVNTMILVGFAWLSVGACSMAIGEFVSAHSHHVQQEENEHRNEGLTNPFLAGLASAVAFSIGGIMPILAAGFISNHKLRLAVIVAAVILGIVSIWLNWCFFVKKSYGEILCQSFNWCLNGYGHFLLTVQTDGLYWRGDVLGNFYSCPFT